MKIIDISRKFFDCDVYPGDPLPEKRELCSIGKNADYNNSSVCACVHTGTHADAPLHFFADGASIDEMPLDAFVGPCTVLEVPKGVITGDFVDRYFPRECTRLLIKGEGRAFFMDSSAQELAERGLKLIGTDSLSVGCKGNEMAPHKAFMRNGIAILENLDLSAVAPGEYFLFAPPVCYNGTEAAPVRAVLVEDYIFWSKKS